MIAPSRLRAIRKEARQAWDVYFAARAAALAAGRAMRATPAGVGRGRAEVAYEHRIEEACEARRWAWVVQQRLEHAESLPVVAHGGRVCPAALERLRLNGHLRSGS